MNFKSNKLRDAVVFALVLGTGNAVLSATAVAQTKPADEAATLDTITVTGSRISTPGLTTSSPVTSIEREDFMRTQPVAVEEFVKQLPSVSPTVGPGTNNGATGAAELDLRGLGSNRTLVLVDGRRPVPYDLSGVVDTNTIPVALIQSVDLLTGGASVVYGADAISGVANFILRRDFEGVEVQSSYGQSTYGDGARQRIEVTMGANSSDGQGNVVFSVGHTKVDPVFQGDRAWGKVSRSSGNGRPQGSGTTVPSLIAGPPGVWGTPGDGGTLDGRGQIDPTTGQIVSDVQTYNFNPVNLFQTGLDRYQATALGRYEINEHAEAYGQVNYTRSRVEASLAPSGLFQEAFDMPIGNPLIPEPARQQLCQAYGIDAANCVPGNATMIEGLTIGRRLTELGPRTNRFDTKTFQVTAGLRGAITDNWKYDAFWSHGESERLAESRNWGSLSKTRQALMSLDGTTCVDPSNGCVPLNVWGPEGSVSPEALKFINLSAFSIQNVEQDNAALNVSGDLGGFKSPWSEYPIGVAVGAEHRRATAGTRSDGPSQIQGEVMGTGAPTPDSQGGFTINEAFGEFIVPLIDNAPGVYALSLETGYRYSHFKTSSNTSDEYGSFKYGINWAPIESLRFRGMFQRANRAPGIGELFAPQVTSLDNLDTDPCAGGAISAAQANVPGTLSNLCVQTGVPAGSAGLVAQPNAGQVNVLTGGNVLLTPEQADTQTIGLVWNPTSNFAMTLDYWKIEMEKTISSQSVDDVVSGCYDPAFNPGLTFNSNCALIGRSPLTGTFNGTTSRGISLILSNQGTLKTDGFDLGLKYGFDLPGSMGRLNLAYDATLVTTLESQPTPESENRDCLGYYSVSCTPNSKYRSILRSSWSYNDLSVSLAWRYNSKMEVEPETGTWFESYREIPSYSYFDFGVNYKLPFNAEVNLSVANLMNKKAPVVGNTIGNTTQNSGNTFPNFYDAIGRFYTLGMTFSF
ncbi:TonB-dependent receptor [Xanthomonas oryzae]|uniref:TonB-dependent receptor n=1 Tax=Xanthomonas oryzae TaxID=347 RepID=A0AAP1EZ19_9XANT|nr:TonB-dependent receptor [Xanthomonas oryzae]KOR44933.1 TonB-dependent receptor [Xanthomonas oryzae]QBG84397.1 TonB-dependent receptor [Xanthomonas oryzae]